MVKIVTISNIPGCIGQFLKYCISGGIGIVIDFSVFSLLVSFFQVPYLISNAISFSLGTIIVCYIQMNWTFQFKSNKNIILYTKYLLSIVIVFLFNNFLLVCGVEIIHLGEIEAKIFQVMVSSVIGYLIQKNFVFRILE
jgi:putative flippase GtrA